MEQELNHLTEDFDRHFPGFPEEQHSYATLSAGLRRGIRDAYLKQVIVRLLREHEDKADSKIIVNPACFIGRHARDLAKHLSDFHVFGADIFPGSNWLYQALPGNRNPENFSFVKDNIRKQQWIASREPRQL